MTAAWVTRGEAGPASDCGCMMGDGEVGRWSEVDGEEYDQVGEDCGLWNGNDGEGDDGAGGPQPLHG